jgi:hypothetical protein
MFALALAQTAVAQDTVAPEGAPPSAPPAVEVAPTEPAPEQAPAPEPAPPVTAPQPTQAQPPPYQPPVYAPPPPGYGYPPPRHIAPAPPPWSYTPQRSPLLTQPWSPPPQPPAQPAPGGAYYYYPPPTYTPPPVTLPPLPPGYSYVPAPLPPLPNAQLAPSLDGPSRNQVYERLHALDNRIAALQAERIGVGGPIFAMVLGYGTMAIAGIVGLTAAENAREIKDNYYDGRGYYDVSLDFNDDGDVDRGDRNNWVKTSRVGAGLSGAGLLIGLLGTAGLRNAVDARRTKAQELKKLQAQHAELRRQLDYGPSVGPNQYGFSVRGRF